VLAKRFSEPTKEEVMAKTSVLRPVRAESRTIKIKIPDELLERIAAVRNKVKDLGLRVDLDEPAVRAIRQVIEQAERELANMSPPTPERRAEDKPVIKPLPVPAKVQEGSHATSQVR
jgi:hypothetical protein